MTVRTIAIVTHLDPGLRRGDEWPLDSGDRLSSARVSRDMILFRAAKLLPLAVAGLAAAAACATDADLRSVAGMANHSRVLLVFAPTLADPRLQEQRRIMAHFAAGAAERDLALVQVAQDRVLGAHDKADKLRHRFDTPDPRYRTLLIGKDGHVALDEAGPIPEATLAGAIDAMPMRQDEVRRARAGLGRPAS